MVSEICWLPLVKDLQLATRRNANKANTDALGFQDEMMEKTNWPIITLRITWNASGIEGLLRRKIAILPQQTKFKLMSKWLKEWIWGMFTLEVFWYWKEKWNCLTFYILKQSAIESVKSTINKNLNQVCVFRRTDLSEHLALCLLLWHKINDFH